MSRWIRRVGGRLGATIGRTKPYAPGTFWEARAEADIYTYDHPDLYADRGWSKRSGELEAQVVPKLLRDVGARTVLVPGAGTGAQYVYLLRHGFKPHGFDISPTLAATCSERFSDVRTQVGNLIGALGWEEPADAAVVSAVLQHIRPNEIMAAVESLKALARKLIVLRELTRVDVPSNYQFVHDYHALFSDWREVHREVADETDRYRTELIAWVSLAVDMAADGAKVRSGHLAAS
jgi:hypothetical protein